MRLFEYRQASTLLLALLGLMLAGEALSRLLRRAMQGARERGTAGVGQRRRRLLTAGTLVALALSFQGAGLLEGAEDGLLRRMGRFAAQLFPPDLSPPFLATLRGPLLQTLAVAGAGTLLGVALAAALTPFASAQLMLPSAGDPWRRGAAGLLGGVLHVTARAALALLRGIPEMLWVLI